MQVKNSGMCFAWFYVQELGGLPENFIEIRIVKMLFSRTCIVIVFSHFWKMFEVTNLSLSHWLKLF